MSGRTFNPPEEMPEGLRKVKHEDQAAELAGVSGRTVQDITQLAEKEPDLHERVVAGQKTVGGASLDEDCFGPGAPRRIATSSNSSRELREPMVTSGVVEDVHLDGASVEAVAVRVAELLREGAPLRNGRPLTTAEVARCLGRGEDFVREHRDELGGVPLGPVGEGKRPRLGFDAERVEAFARGGKAEPATEPSPRVNPSRRRRQATGDLLPIQRPVRGSP